MSDSIDELALRHAVYALNDEWNKPEWSEQSEKDLDELAGMIAAERQVDKRILLRAARLIFPNIGRHYLKHTIQ